MFTSTELMLLHTAGEEVLKISKPELLEKLVSLIKETAERERRHAEEEQSRKAAVPMTVPNFLSVEPGTLVVRSEHWKKQNYKPDNTQIGIVTKLKLFKDDICGMVAFPDVFWQGESFSNFCGPLNVALHDGTVLPTVVMNANQH